MPFSLLDVSFVLTVIIPLASVIAATLAQVIVEGGQPKWEHGFLGVRLVIVALFLSIANAYPHNRLAQNQIGLSEILSQFALAQVFWLR